MTNYIILEGIISSEIKYAQSHVYFRLDQKVPKLNIPCLIWDEELIEVFKDGFSKKGDIIKVQGILKSNNYIKNNRLVYDYEVIIKKIL